MDKRIIKTENAVYDAFGKVLNTKCYSAITIEDILKESGVSRSTFYAHYKTKEELLKSITDHIFEHVFSHSLSEETTHDFSKSDIFDYSHLITHTLYHLHEEKALVKAILSNDTRDTFLNAMREKVNHISTLVVRDNFSNDIPMELKEAKVTETFILCVDYWFKHNCEETPEKITQYFFKLNTK